MKLSSQTDDEVILMIACLPVAGDGDLNVLDQISPALQFLLAWPHAPTMFTCNHLLFHKKKLSPSKLLPYFLVALRQSFPLLRWRQASSVTWIVSLGWHSLISCISTPSQNRSLHQVHVLSSSCANPLITKFSISDPKIANFCLSSGLRHTTILGIPEVTL